MIEKVPALGEYGLHFKYLLLDENVYTKERLLQIRNIVSMLFLTEAHYDIQLLEAELLNLYEQETDKQAVSLLLNWFRQLAVHGKVAPEDYAALDYVYRTKEEVRTMLVTALEQERRSIYLQGEADGIAKGRVEGEADGIAKGERTAQRQMILHLFQWHFASTPAEQTKLMQQLDEIENSQHLSELINGLLHRALPMDAFLTQLTEYLASGPTGKGA